VKFPEENFYGSRVEVGQEIYSLGSEPEYIYIKHSSGFARFSVEKVVNDITMTLHSGCWKFIGIDIFSFVAYNNSNE
jgi:hypothetical protein